MLVLKWLAAGDLNAWHNRNRSEYPKVYNDLSLTKEEALTRYS